MSKPEHQPGGGRVSIIAPPDTGTVLAVACIPNRAGGGTIQLGIGHREPPSEPDSELDFTIDAHIDLGASHVAALRTALDAYAGLLALSLGD